MEMDTKNRVNSLRVNELGEISGRGFGRREYLSGEASAGPSFSVEGAVDVCGMRESSRVRSWAKTKEEGV